MIKKFILPYTKFRNSFFYSRFICGKTEEYLANKYHSILSMIGKYLESENINWVSVREGSVAFCYYVEIDISNDNSTESIKNKGLIPVEKSPYETQSDFDYTAEKYYKEIVKDLVKKQTGEKQTTLIKLHYRRATEKNKQH